MWFHLPLCRRSEQASESTTLALARPIRKSFKRYLKRSHGASASGAKAQLQLVMGVLSAVMTEQKSKQAKPDRGELLPTYHVAGSVD